MRNKFLVLFVVAVLAGCTMPIEIDMPLPERKPVVNCLFTTGEPFMVHLAQSSGRLDTLARPIENAKVLISTNHGLHALLPYAGLGFYSDSTLFPQAGVVYSLSVDIPGFAKIMAHDSIPATSSKFTYRGYRPNAWYLEGTGYSGLSFDIEASRHINYYEALYRASFLYVFRNDTTPRFRIGHFRCPTISDDDGVWQSLFTNQLFERNKFTIELVNNNIENYRMMHDLDFEVQIIQGSPAYYKYRKTLIRHLDAQYADFWEPMEPVIMFSNIENGYGIFAGYRSQTIPIIFPD